MRRAFQPDSRPPPAEPLHGASLHWAGVFDTLGERIQGALGGLGKGGKLDDDAVSKAMREIRLALLEADVNFEVAKDFTASVKERALGQEVTKSLTPGQEVVKIVHEELTSLMGSGDSRLAFGRPPTVIRTHSPTRTPSRSRRPCPATASSGPAGARPSAIVCG